MALEGRLEGSPTKPTKPDLFPGVKRMRFAVPAKWSFKNAWLGVSPADPRILMSLWLYATVRGVGSARRLNG